MRGSTEIFWLMRAQQRLGFEEMDTMDTNLAQNTTCMADANRILKVIIVSVLGGPYALIELSDITSPSTSFAPVYFVYVSSGHTFAAFV